VVTAQAGDSVFALAGIYKGGVVIDKQLVLRGWGAVIDASSSSFGNGVQIVGPGGSGSTVQGFKIVNAKFEGILVGTAPVAPDGTVPQTGEPVSNVRILGNVLVNNGTGFGSDAGQCATTAEARGDSSPPPVSPGDCGQTIHLVSVTNSLVQGNSISRNVGGILLTDEFGPTSGNTISANVSVNNSYESGITLAGYNSNAVNPVTLQPTGMAGVFSNLVQNNTVSCNGLKGQGAGILLGGGAILAGVYGNVLSGNVAQGNGLAGVTIHQHLIGDLNGNAITRNRLSNNNLTGDFNFVVPAPDPTGILVASGANGLPPNSPLLPGPISGTVIRGNLIFAVKVGIWTLGVDPATTTIARNIFGPGVTTPISTN
jgi:hypothetical protein